MAKYDSLRAFLARLDAVVWSAKLNEIEDILGSKLPSSALNHRTWWANSGGNLVHQNAWLQAGWSVEKADLSRGVVSFRRSRINGVGSARAVSKTKAQRARVASAAQAKISEALGQPVSVTLRAEWTPVGQLDSLSDQADWVHDEGAVLRMTCFGHDDPTSILIDCGQLSQVVGALRSLGGEKAADALLEDLQLPHDGMTQVHVLRPGNAWLLSEGRGRKADLAAEEERRMVAQLLLLQERQSGRGQKLLSL